MYNMSMTTHRLVHPVWLLWRELVAMTFWEAAGLLSSFLSVVYFVSYGALSSTLVSIARVGLRFVELNEA